MHQAVIEWVKSVRPDYAEVVLDVGGRDINGSARIAFPDASTYQVVDLYEGPNVDIVGDITKLKELPQADVVLCLEVLEHAENWAEIVVACERCVVPGGTLIITCAGPGRGAHSALDEQPIRPDEWYENVSGEQIADVLIALGFEEVQYRQLGLDTQVAAVADTVRSTVYPLEGT